MSQRVAGHVRTQHRVVPRPHLHGRPVHVHRLVRARRPVRVHLLVHERRPARVRPRRSGLHNSARVKAVPRRQRNVAPLPHALAGLHNTTILPAAFLNLQCRNWRAVSGVTSAPHLRVKYRPIFGLARFRRRRLIVV